MIHKLELTLLNYNAFSARKASKSLAVRLLAIRKHPKYNT